MENELSIQKEAMAPESRNDYSDTVLAQALLISAGAREELTQAKTVRAEAERRRESAEAEAARVLDELFTGANLQAQKLMEEATAIKKAAEADRARARQEIQDATTIKIEAEMRCQQIEAEAKEKAEKTIREALQQVDTRSTELRQRAEEEARKLLVEAATIHATAQEEMETQRILADAARIQARAAQIQGWATGKSAPQPQSIDHDLSPSHESAQVKTEEAAPVEHMDPESLQAPAYDNGHKDFENGLVNAEISSPSLKS